MKKILLYFAVSVSGGCVLVIEIAGTRMLAPFYGINLTILSALLSVTLAALSIGYFFGGRWADRKPSIKKLSAFISGAGIWIIFVPWFKHPLFNLLEPLGVQYSALISIFILFFLPLLLLGIINPYAIRLMTAGKNNMGRITGNVYALSTISGVVAALLTAYELIPCIGVTRIFLVTALALLITGGICWLSSNNRKVNILIVIIFTIIVVFICYLPVLEGSADPAKGLLAVRQSPYGELRVIDTESGRFLFQDGVIRGITDETGYLSYLHSTAVMEIPKFFFSQPGTMLLLGIGTGSVIKQYTGDGWKVDAVETNPAIVQLGHEYFNLNKWNGSLVEMDTRRFLSTTKDNYDVILLDVKNGPLPFYLLTEEAFGLAASHLKSDGIIALNIETTGWDDLIIRRVGATLRTYFQDVLALPMEEPPDQIGEVVLIASNRKLEPLQEPEKNIIYDPDWRFGPGYQKKHAWDNRFIPNTKNILPLTDDLNPIDLREDIINNEARQKFASTFPKKDLLR